MSEQIDGAGRARPVAVGSTDARTSFAEDKLFARKKHFGYWTATISAAAAVVAALFRRRPEHASGTSATNNVVVIVVAFLRWPL